MESFEAYIARIKSTAHFVDIPPRMLKRSSKKAPTLAKKLKHLDPKELDLLHELLSGKWQILKTIAYRLIPGGYEVRSLYPGSVVHVVVDGACSCPDYEFRQRKCKHLKELEACAK